MEYNPYPYQQFAIDFILERRYSCLLLDMGMGKTVISLTAVERLIYDYFRVKRVLIIAPLKPAKETWLPEVEKWDHLRHLQTVSLMGNPAQRIKALSQKGDLFIINRENVTWLVDYYHSHKMKWDFDMVLIDELSSFKSSKSRRFRALKKVRPAISFLVGLTGTPTPNGLLDLWPQMYLIDQGKSLGKTLTGYREKYFRPDKRNQTTIFSWKLCQGAEKEIYRKIKPVCISMKSGDFLDLPERLMLYHKIPLSVEGEKAYRQLERDTLLPFANGVIDAPTAGVLSGKLLQLAGGAVYDEEGRANFFHQDKLLALDRLIEEANGQPVLIFYGFRHEKERIISRYQGVVDIKEETAVARWNRGEISILLAHPASAGHGLNLQGGGHLAIWYGLPTSLELYQQANKRLHRPGQTETVLIHHLLMENTYDIRVLEGILAPKEIRQNALIEALQAKLQEMKGAAT